MKPTHSLGLAKVETFLRDLDAMRRAVRSHDTFAIEAAWEDLERWLYCVDPNPTEGAHARSREDVCMDTFGGKPTEGEGYFLVAFIAVLIFGLGFIGGIIFCTL